MATVHTRPSPSAVSTLISRHSSSANSDSSALPLEILHNLRHQHSWLDLRLHVLSDDTHDNSSSSSSSSIIDLDESPTTTTPYTTNSTITSNSNSNPPSASASSPIYLISGLPPRHTYLHPDFQNHLVRQKLADTSVRIQREWVLPVSLGEKYTLKKMCRVFDALPPRGSLERVETGQAARTGGAGGGQAEGEAKGTAGAAAADFPEWKDAKRVVMGMLSTNGVGGDGTVVYYIMQEGEVKPRQNG